MEPGDFCVYVGKGDGRGFIPYENISLVEWGKDWRGYVVKIHVLDGTIYNVRCEDETTARMTYRIIHDKIEAYYGNTRTQS